VSLDPPSRVTGTRAIVRLLPRPLRARPGGHAWLPPALRAAGGVSSTWSVGSGAPPAFSWRASTGLSRPSRATSSTRGLREATDHDGRRRW